MLFWLTNLDFGASEIENILPDSISVLLAADVSVKAEAAITMVTLPDIAIQTE